MADTENAVLELIELADGDIVLKRANSDDKPLIEIRFSEDSDQALSVSLSSAKMLVAKAMVEAGIEAYAQIQADQDVEGSAVVH